MKDIKISPFFALLVGLAVAASKIVYSFFPLFNLTDVIVFGAIGAVLGYVARSSSLLTSLGLALPAMVLSGYFVARLGGENVMSGVGTGWLVSMIVIPISAIAGVFLGSLAANSAAQKHA